MKITFTSPLERNTTIISLDAESPRDRQLCRLTFGDASTEKRITINRVSDDRYEIVVELIPIKEIALASTPITTITAVPNTRT